jgi:RNA polymerase sigma-70 factor (ECF subfamily)
VVNSDPYRTKQKAARRSIKGVRDNRLDEIEAIYRSRYPAFLRVAAAIIGDDELGADAVQDGFAGAVRSRRGFRGGSLDAWLWAAVVNSARTNRRRRAALLESAADDLVAPIAEQHPRAARLREAIANLPDRQRLVLFLHYFADLDYLTIAKVVGIRPGTVGATLNGARAALRKALIEEDVCIK